MRQRSAEQRRAGARRRHAGHDLHVHPFPRGQRQHQPRHAVHARIAAADHADLLARGRALDGDAAALLLAAHGRRDELLLRIQRPDQLDICAIADDHRALPQCRQRARRHLIRTARPDSNHPEHTQFSLRYRFGKVKIQRGSRAPGCLPSPPRRVQKTRSGPREPSFLCIQNPQHERRLHGCATARPNRALRADASARTGGRGPSRTAIAFAGLSAGVRLIQTSRPALRTGRAPSFSRPDPRSAPRAGGSPARRSRPAAHAFAK